MCEVPIVFYEGCQRIVREDGGDQERPEVDLSEP